MNAQFQFVVRALVCSSAFLRSMISWVRAALAWDSSLVRAATRCSRSSAIRANWILARSPSVICSLRSSVTRVHWRVRSSTRSSIFSSSSRKPRLDCCNEASRPLISVARTLNSSCPATVRRRARSRSLTILRTSELSCASGRSTIRWSSSMVTSTKTMATTSKAAAITSGLAPLNALNTAASASKATRLKMAAAAMIRVFLRMLMRKALLVEESGPRGQGAPRGQPGAGLPASILGKQFQPMSLPDRFRHPGGVPEARGNRASAPPAGKSCLPTVLGCLTIRPVNRRHNHTLNP